MRHYYKTLTPLLFVDVFNITNMRGKVAKFCIFKTVYRLGEDIIGTFNFSEGDIPCLQVQFLSFHVAMLSFCMTLTKIGRSVCFAVFCQPAEWGGGPAAVPAASRAGGERNRAWTTPGIMPPHCLQSLLSPSSSQCHTRLQHRHRSVTRRLKCVSLWNCHHWNAWKLFSFCSNPEVASALWICDCPRAAGATHGAAESIGGHRVDRRRTCRCGYIQLGSARESFAHQPGLGVLYVPLYGVQ